MYSFSTMALCLVLSSTNGFGPPLIGMHQREVRSVFEKLKPTCATNSDTSPEDSGSAIRQMSWFLTTQLLESALKEASKGENKSKISMDDIQKLADVLQRTEEEILQPKAETSELDEKAMASEVNDVKNEVSVVDEMDGNLMVGDQAQEANSEREITSTQAEDLGTAASNETVDESEEVSAQEASIAELSADQPGALESENENEKSELSEEAIAAEESEVGDPAESLMDVATVVHSEIDTVKENPSVEGNNESATESKGMKATEMEGDTVIAEKEETDNGSLRPGAARIPDVISTAFGRSLEVISSAVPPLLDSSIPKTSGETQSIQASKKSQDEKAGEQIEAITAIENFPSTATKMSLETTSRLPPEKNEDVPQDELAAKYAEMTLEDKAFEILKDLGMIEIHEPLTEEEQQNYSKVVDSTENGVVRTEGENDKEEVMSARNTEVPKEKNETLSKRQRLLSPIRRVFEKSKEKLSGKSAATTTAPVDAKSSLSEAITRARRQPKSPSEEAKLAEKYGQLSLEDRAYAILLDLGMI